MKYQWSDLHSFTKRYIDWVIRLGRLKFSLLGVAILATFALLMQFLLSWIFLEKVHFHEIIRSIAFGLVSAPFVVYFFTLLVERLERSRMKLAESVTALRQEVSERINAEKRLSEALESLAQNHRDKSALLATMSHELRTPLNGIIGLSRILLDDNLSENQRDYLQTINMSAISLGHIFSDIIDLEKIDANRIELDLKEVDFPRFINDIANFAILMTEQRHLRFTLHCEPNLPNWLCLDTARLSQILWNLINNAVKFTPKGEIKLSVTRKGLDEFHFAIQDTGIGIPAEDVDKIFGMYYQVQSSGYKPAGSGIGLSISKTIAQLMGGDLTVSSELGKGSTFCLTIRAKPALRPLHSLDKIPATLRILLVEDMEVNVIVAKAVLEKLGYTVDVARTGQEALELFDKNQYDLVLLDIQLPDISGFDVAQTLRKKYEDGDYDFLPPLIALTANLMQSKQDYEKKGMDDVLRKPLALDALIACLLYYFDAEDCLQPRTNLPMLPSETISTPNYNYLDPTKFDLSLLQELEQILGAEFVIKNLELFASTMSEYVASLQQALQDYDAAPQDLAKITELSSIAHKIKGAVASVGLKQLQHLMNCAQHHESSHWAAHIHQDVALVCDNWQEQVAQLIAVLRGQGNAK